MLRLAFDQLALETNTRCQKSKGSSGLQHGTACLLFKQATGTGVQASCKASASVAWLCMARAREADADKRLCNGSVQEMRNEAGMLN